MSSGCTSRYSVLPNQGEGQKTIHRNGEDVICSQLKHRVIVDTVSEYISPSQREDVVIGITNLTKKQIEIAQQNIKVTFIPAKPDMPSELRLFTYDELLKEEKQRQAWQTAAIILSFIGSAGGGRHSTHHGTYQVRTSGSPMHQMHQLKQTSKNNEEALKKILQKETIFPNDTYWGLIKVKIPKFTGESGQLIVVINLQDESHKFIFNLTRKKEWWENNIQ